MNCILQPTLNAEMSQSKKIVSLCKTPLSYITPMHTLPLFCPTPCMPSPYSVPLRACPPPILSHPVHTLPLFYPTHGCMPSSYSIPPMYALPLFYPTSCIPSPIFYPSPCIPTPYSIQPHACPPPILSQLMHTLPVILFHPIHALPLFYPTVCMSSPVLYQPTHATPVFQLIHALLTPCHMNLEGMFLLCHLRMLLLNLLTLQSMSSSFT